MISRQFILTSSPRSALPRRPLPIPRRSLGTSSSSPTSGLRSTLVSTAWLLGTGAFLYYAHDSRAGIHKWVLLPAVTILTAQDPERAHELAVKAVGSGFAPVDTVMDDERLEVEVFGQTFSNPLGIAAGFDKNGEAIDGLFKLGFGYVEIGSVTPEPQPGNPKPRVFRVPDSQSVINRYGFNSEGHTAVLTRLRNRVRNFVTLNYAALPPVLHAPPPAFPRPNYDPCAELLALADGVETRLSDELDVPRSLRRGKALGINLGKNKSSDPDSIEDFVNGVKTFGPFADVLIINVSSPNTPGLRSLQRKGMLEELLEGVVKARDTLPGLWKKPPILVKVAPDLDQSELEDIAHAVTATGVNGIIVSNTTISRPASAGTSLVLKEVGGLSGPPVKPLALKALSELYRATDGKVTLIGCGGISSGKDALDYAKAGASLVQLYTSFVYGGVGLPRNVKDEIVSELEKEGTTWKKVVGTGVTKKQIATPPPKLVLPEPPKATEPEQDFATGLAEAKKELEVLLKELAHFDSSAPTKTPATETPLATSSPVVTPSHTNDPVPVVAIINPLAVPANALLDPNQIAVLLDPGVEQVKAKVIKVEEEEKAERPQPSLHDGKRWV